MNETETAALLAVCSSYDLRRVGDEDVAAWHMVLGGLDAADAVLAVRRWYAEHRERIMPGDVTRLARELRRDRAERAPEVDPPDADPDDPAAYVAALRAGRRRAVAGVRERDLAGLPSVFRRLP
jgi:hypothetical protein